MAYDRLTLMFSEPVNTTTLNFAALTLQSDSIKYASTVNTSLTASSTVNVTLTKSAKVLSTGSMLNQIVIQFSQYDANMIKSNYPLCLNADNCFLGAPLLECIVFNILI